MKQTGLKLLPERTQLERAFAAKDAGYDGLFYVAVRTTGIFCRPSCNTNPKLENVEFFPGVGDCLEAGYRPCKRCRPFEANGAPPEWAGRIMAAVEVSSGKRLGTEDLQAFGVTPERARRWFEEQFGMTFAEWQRAYRLAFAFTQLQEGERLDEAVFGSGFESHSGFRDAYGKAFGTTPGAVRRGMGRIVTAMLETPLGPMVAGATDSGICWLEFRDGRHALNRVEELRRLHGLPAVPGKHGMLDRLKEELEAYFAGGLTEFSVPLDSRGSPFQQQVWSELRRIPYGQTVSYADLARRLGREQAQRAVAQANAVNRICVLIPCHRVIAKNEALGGYGGGVWRKRLLLEIERAGARMAVRQVPARDFS